MWFSPCPTTGWKFTVDLIEPNRALVLWTPPQADPEQRYQVTWCCWTGSLSTCQNKSSGTNGVVITHLDSWVVYDITVVDGKHSSAPLFHTRVRTRPDSESCDKNPLRVIFASLTKWRHVSSNGYGHDFVRDVEHEHYQDTFPRVGVDQGQASHYILLSPPPALILQVYLN